MRSDVCTMWLELLPNTYACLSALAVKVSLAFLSLVVSILCIHLLLEYTLSELEAEIKGGRVAMVALVLQVALELSTGKSATGQWMWLVGQAQAHGIGMGAGVGT